MSAGETDPPALPAPPPGADLWQDLRAHTPARIALGRAGSSLRTASVLEFGLAHARARDAVHAALDAPALQAQLLAEGWSVAAVRSAAPSRSAYLARPDWGRRLHADAEPALAALAQTLAAPPSLLLVIGDGLSAVAVQRHALPLLRELRPLLAGLAPPGPVVLATQARVALGDAIGERLGAQLVLVLIGERPGLSAPDSLGLYLTHGPRVGRSDAERDCISNVHGAGLSYAAAAAQVAAKLAEARARGGTGVAAPAASLPPA